MDPTALLNDPSYTVPPVPDAVRGVAWLRSHVVRFSEGDDHRRRRALVEAQLDRIDLSVLQQPGDHVATLAASLGLPRSVGDDVRTVAACYQPDKRTTTSADVALARLVDAAGGSWDEATAGLICILVQGCEATAALIAGSRPPVTSTVRVAPDGTTVTVPLDAIPFGAGRHACPARAHAEALARRR
ncbi:MAG TPA: hypothetical protein VIR58_18005 [Acidimicrobiales bacterium]